MSRSRRAAALALSLAVAIPAIALASKKAPRSAAEEDALIVHALNRLGYGPRPGDAEKVRAIGLDEWIDEQLHPDRIADHAMASHLASLRTIRLSTAEKVRRPIRYERCVSRPRRRPSSTT